MIYHGKNGLENTHREQCFVAGAVMVEGFYFSPVCRTAPFRGVRMQGNRRVRRRKEHFVTDEQ